MDIIQQLPDEVLHLRKKALFINPYIDSLGGGERYMFTLASLLLSEHWQVDCLWPNDQVFKTASQKFNLPLAGINAVHFSLQSIFSRFQQTRTYDLTFTVSDGALPFMFGKKNIIHFQVPFHDVNGQEFSNSFKKKKLHHFVANSHFTKQVVDNEYAIDSKVIYPPVDVSSFTSQKKKKQILYVGRFSTLLQQKGHHILIEAFTRLLTHGIQDYQLVLTGSTEVGSDEYLSHLNQLAANLPIRIITNPSFSTLQTLYGQSKFFWSASGYEVDEIRHPEQCEHFGISVVEAMAAGCIPLALNKGGHKEIIQHQQTGLLWNDLEELVQFTKNLISDVAESKKIKTAAIERAAQFSHQAFATAWKKIIYGN